jgi:Secretion system C-terminal sorting domain/Fibronectin type III domain
MKMIKTLVFIPSSMLLLVVLCLFGGIDAAQAQGCSQPSNLTSNVLSPGTVSLSWSAIGGAVNYTLQYRLGSSGIWTNGGTMTTTNKVLTNLLPERVYTWRVRASCSSYSSVATFNSGGGISGNVDCSAPSNLVHTTLTATSVSLGWSSIVGVFNYSVQYRVANATTWLNGGTVTGTSLTLGGLVAGRTYQWRVKASCSVYSSTTTFTVGSSSGGGGGSTTCSAPSNTNTNLIMNTSAQVSWEPQGGVLNYTVQYRLASSATYVTVGTVTSASTTITGLQAGQNYVWRVKANCSPYSSDVQFSTTGTAIGGGGTGGSTSCSSPSNTNTNLVLSNSAQVSWEPQGGALNYTVQYRLATSFSYITLGTVTSSSVTITGLSAGREYVWRVKANCSPYGSDVQFSTPFSSGFTMGMPNNSANSVRVFPNPVSADLVQVQTEGNGGQIFILNTAGQVVANEVIMEGIQPIDVSRLNNGIYFVRVQDAAGKSQVQKLVVAH